MAATGSRQNARLEGKDLLDVAVGRFVEVLRGWVPGKYRPVPVARPEGIATHSVEEKQGKLKLVLE